MPAKKGDRIRIGIVIGLSVVLASVVALRYFKSKTAKGTIVPIVVETKPAPTRLAMPEMPPSHLKGPALQEEQRPRLDAPLLARDIFRPTAPPQKRKKLARSKAAHTRTVPTFQLKGTITGGAEPLAIIDDRFLRRGDVIKNYTVARIDGDKVVLRSDDHEINLEVYKLQEPPYRR